MKHSQDADGVVFDPIGDHRPALERDRPQAFDQVATRSPAARVIGKGKAGSPETLLISASHLISCGVGDIEEDRLQIGQRGGCEPYSMGHDPPCALR